MRLSRDDSTPSPILQLNCGEPKLTVDNVSSAFLYQGSVGAAYNMKELDKIGITHILTCASNIAPRFGKEFTYKILPLLDNTDQNIEQHFDDARAFINSCRKIKGKILVHCFAGKSRASTITLSYMIKEMKIDLKESLDHLKKRRPIAQPNFGFMQQLIKFEFDIL